MEHVHFHVIPRVKDDWMNNDDIYSEINQSGRLDSELRSKGPDAESRIPRTMSQMEVEANTLKAFFTPYENVWA